MVLGSLTANLLAICTWLCFPSVNIIMAMVSMPKPLGKLATTMTLKDGRKLAYEVRGSLDRKHKVFWNHGIISSRYEIMSTDEGVLEELDMVLIGIDRPTYGLSDPDPDRTYRSYADDLAQLADYLGVARFFVAGVSGGGPYAFAAAYFLPERVRGVMTISTLAPPGTMTPAEEARFYAEMDVVSEAVTRLFKNHRFLGHLVKEFSQSLYGGRLLYHDFLKPLGRACLSLMAEVDRKCIREQHPEYLDIIVPESVRQKTAAMFFEDFFLFEQPWEFDVRDIRPKVQASVHIWHGTGDKQLPWVNAEVLKRLMPHAHLHIEEGGGQFAYYACSPGAQRAALQALLKTGAPLMLPVNGQAPMLANGKASS